MEKNSLSFIDNIENIEDLSLDFQPKEFQDYLGQEELKKKVSWCFYLEYQWNFYCKITQVCTTSADSM